MNHDPPIGDSMMPLKVEDLNPFLRIWINWVSQLLVLVHYLDSTITNSQNLDDNLDGLRSCSR